MVFFVASEYQNQHFGITVIKYKHCGGFFKANGMAVKSDGSCGLGDVL